MRKFLLVNLLGYLKSDGLHFHKVFNNSEMLEFTSGVPVYLAPWTACPPGGQANRGWLAPGGQAKLSRDILPPALVILTPGGQAVQAGLSCPPSI